MAIQKAESAQFVSELLVLFQRYQEMLEKSGKTVRRSKRPQTEQMFADMDVSRQNYLRERLTSEIAIMQELATARESATDSTRQLWRFLKLNNLTPCSDLFDKVHENDMIQVYSPEQLLLFASTNLYDYVSFTMEQLYTQTWYESTKRDPEIEQLLAKAAMKLFSGEIKETVSPGAPVHQIEEVNTEKQIKSQMNIKWISPVYSGHRVVAMCAVVECVTL